MYHISRNGYGNALECSGLDQALSYSAHNCMMKPDMISNSRSRILTPEAYH
jgi:hypothetical protein